MTPLGVDAFGYLDRVLLQVAVAICWFIQSMTSRSFQTTEREPD